MAPRISCRALDAFRDLAGCPESVDSAPPAGPTSGRTPANTTHMKPITNVLFLAATAVPAFAQAHTPRTAPPIPTQSSVKVDAPPTIPTGALVRPLDLDSSSRAVAPSKPFSLGEERTRLAGAELDRLHYTTQLDGSTWVSGRTYKARFGSGGATYIPYLGSRAPRSFPLEMSLASASIDGVDIPLAPAECAVREENRIVIDRGRIDEVYELALDSVEQTFVIGERPPAGDLTLRVRLETEMSRSESESGFTYSNELGSVQYSRAFVRGRDGHRIPVSSRLVDGGVEIVIARQVLDDADFPLVVDPVITTFAIDTVTYDSVESDVSYDLSTNRYLVVYERPFTATDGDIYSVFVDVNGVVSPLVYLDNTSEDWRSPQCANMNVADQFLMVAQARNILGAPGWNVWGMTIDAHTGASGWKTLISIADQTGDKVLPDVGGDSYDGPGATSYCVVWRRDFQLNDQDIHARLVSSNSTLVGPATLLVDNSANTLDTWPSISKSNGVLGGDAAWTVAWHRTLSSTESDIHAARIYWAGGIASFTTPIATSPGIDYYPRVSSPLDDGRTLVVYAHNWGSEHDIFYSLLSGTTVLSSGNLSGLEPAGFLQQNQVEYSIDSDGQRFVVVYSEQLTTIDFDIWVSSFGTIGSQLFAVEAHASLDFTSAQSFRTDVIANRSGGGSSRRFFSTWDSTYDGTQRDIRGGFYDRPIGGWYTPFCFGDGSGLACPCGNNGWPTRGCGNSSNANGSYLGASGNAQTGVGDDLTFSLAYVPPNVTCTLFQGTGTASSLFGDGVRCVAGTQVRISSKNSNAFGSATWPSGAEPDISVAGLVPAVGGRRYYQVSYRNSAAFCTPATFNISNGTSVLWLP